MVYTSPETYPAAIGVFARLMMPVPELFRSSLIVPFPVMLETATSYDVPLVPTGVTAPVANTPATSPVKVAIEKSAGSTPVTASENNTLYVTVVRLVVAMRGTCLVIAETEGTD